MKFSAKILNGKILQNKGTVSSVPLNRLEYRNSVIKSNRMIFITEFIFSLVLNINLFILIQLIGLIHLIVYYLQNVLRQCFL